MLGQHSGVYLIVSKEVKHQANVYLLFHIMVLGLVVEKLVVFNAVMQGIKVLFHVYVNLKELSTTFTCKANSALHLSWVGK